MIVHEHVGGCRNHKGFTPFQYYAGRCVEVNVSDEYGEIARCKRSVGKATRDRAIETNSLSEHWTHPVLLNILCCDDATDRMGEFPGKFYFGLWEYPSCLAPFVTVTLPLKQPGYIARKFSQILPTRFLFFSQTTAEYLERFSCHRMTLSIKLSSMKHVETFNQHLIWLTTKSSFQLFQTTDVLSTDTTLKSVANRTSLYLVSLS